MENNNILIQKAGSGDLKEILALQKLAFQTEAEAHGNYDIQPLKQTYESICADFETYTFLKATVDDRIIGSVKSKMNDGIVWVGKLIVSPDFRRKGLGKQLLKEIEKLYPDAIRFQLFTAASSIHNIRLYESVGYKLIGEFTDNEQAGLILVEMAKEKNKNPIVPA